MQRSRAIAGVARAEFLRATALSLDPALPRVALLARDIDRGDAAARLPLVGDALRVPPVRRRPRGSARLWPIATGWRPARVMTLPLAGRAVTFTVAGVWRDYARQQGAVVIERSRYVALTGDDAVNEAALWLAPGVDAAAVRDDVARAAGAGRVLDSQRRRDLRKLSLAVFDRTFAVTYALRSRRGADRPRRACRRRSAR